MADFLMRIDVDTATAQAWFFFAGEYVRDAHDPLTDVMHEVVWPAIRGQLDSEGVRGGEPWQPLSAEYQAWKDLHYPGRPILMLTGDMERALFDPLSYLATRESLIYFPDSDYLHWHQEGGYVEGRPPQRVVLDLIVDDYEKVQGIFDLWLFELASTAEDRSPSLFPHFSAPLPNITIPGL